MPRTVLLILLATIGTISLVLPGEAREPAPAAPAVRVDRDVEYAQGAEGPLSLNVARPADAKGALPCVVVLHGGGWAAGRKEQHDNLIQVLAQEGFVAATVGYSLCPGCPWPAQIHDAKAAVRFLRAKAQDYHIDPARIAALGFSAGAHLAMLLGTLDPADGLEGPDDVAYASSKVQAVVAFFGPTDMEGLVNAAKTDLQRRLKRQALNTLLGPIFAKDASAMSPIRYVDSSDAPMLIFQGTRDRLVPYGQSIAMLERLHEAKVRAEVTFLVGAGHGWPDPLLSATVSQTEHFLDRMFRPQRVERFAQRLRTAPK